LIESKGGCLPLFFVNGKDMNKKNGIILGLIAIAVVFTIWWGWPRDRDVLNNSNQTNTATRADCRGEEKADVNYCAPNFTLNTLDGKKVELYENGGKPTIINFWASWCPPCKKEMPLFEEAYKEYKDQVNFLMLNATAFDKEEQMQTYLKEGGFTFPVLLDPYQEQYVTVSQTIYSVLAFPTTFVIDEKGKIVYKHQGEMSSAVLDDVMDRLVNKKGFDS
jgi:thiol-disulfide isomerase/thioredoxin